jgi:hypothetical protein
MKSYKGTLTLTPGGSASFPESLWNACQASSSKFAGNSTS